MSSNNFRDSAEFFIFSLENFHYLFKEQYFGDRKIRREK